jgi:hypothetical protein
MRITKLGKTRRRDGQDDSGRAFAKDFHSGVSGENVVATEARVKFIQSLGTACRRKHL